MEILAALCRDCRGLPSQAEAIPHRRLRLEAAAFDPGSVRETYVCRSCGSTVQRLVPDDVERPTAWL